MAYGAKYLIRFSDVYQNSVGQYEALIYKKDYVGAIYELTTTDLPISIETDRGGDKSYRPIIASTASVNLLFGSGLLSYWNAPTPGWISPSGTWDPSTFNFSEFLFADFDTFYIEIKRNSSIKWKGYYSPTSDVVLSEIKPIYFSLNFSDFSLAKSSKYFDAIEDRQIGFDSIEKTSIKDLLVDSILSAELNYEIRINFPYTKVQPDTIINDDGTFSPKTLSMEDMYIFKNALLIKSGDYFSYFDVLSGVCSQFGLMAYQKNGIVYISSYEELMNVSSRIYKRYNGSTGVYISSITESDSPLAINSSTFKELGRTQKIRYSLPYKYLDIESQSSNCSNSFNSFLWGFDTETGVLGLSGFKKNLILDLPSSKTIYKTVPSPPYEYRYGAELEGYNAPLDYNQYLETLPISVSEGDIISSNSYWANDAGLVASDPDNEAFTYIATVLTFIDRNNVLKTFYLSYNTTDPDNLFWLGSIPSSGNEPTSNFKNIKVPFSGQLSLRVLRPTSIAETNKVWIEYMTLQVYKKQNIETVPNSTISRTFYNNKKSNEDILELKAIPFFFYGDRYLNTIGESKDYANSSVVPNVIIDEWNRYLKDDYSISTPNTIQRSVGRAIQRNEGLLNTSIEGSYKSDYYDIGQKFTYDIQGIGSKTFCLLDYKIDLKNSSQDSIIYSCLFTDDSSLSLISQKLEDF